MSESDEAFLNRIVAETKRGWCDPHSDPDWPRLLALARRGAATKWRPIDDIGTSYQCILHSHSGVVFYGINHADGITISDYTAKKSVFSAFIPFSALGCPEDDEALPSQGADSAAAERRGMVKGLRMAAAMSRPNSIIISDFILTRATQLEQETNSADNR